MTLSKPIKIAFLSAVIFLTAFSTRYYQWQREGINPDEPAWQQRVENFSVAVSKGEWQFTQQSLHPAVTLSWLAAAGRDLAGFGDVSVFHYPFVDPLIFWQIHLMELVPIMLVTVLSCALAFYLLSRLVPPAVAFITSVVISLDPFYISNARFLQMDALLASFVFLSFLAVLVYQRTKQFRFLLLSGVLAGLSILTKINGVVILPVVGVVLFTEPVLGVIRTRKIKINFWKKLVFIFAIFLAISGVVFFILYPSMWVQPVLTIKNLIYGILNRGLTDTGDSVGDVFFWGRVLVNAGPSFYPLTILLRTTPLVLLGSLLAVASLFSKKRVPETKYFVFYNLAFIFLTVLEMTLVAKKGERYVLPVFLSLDTLAVLGFSQFINFSSNFRKLGILLMFLVQFGLSVYPLSWHYGSYYNQLLGSAPGAVYMTTVGWGEGNTEIAEYINSQPNAKNLFVSAFYGDSLRPAVKVGDIWYPDMWNRGDRDADLVVFYVNQIQRQKNLSLWQEYQSQTPLKTVTINGVAYAYIYKGPRVYLAK